MAVGIYKITSPSNKVYIGQSYNLLARELGYKRSKSKGQPKLYASFQKYGVDQHIFEVIHELPDDIDQDTLNNYEVLYWDFYSSVGVDMLNTKYPGTRGKHSKETRLKLSIAHTGKFLTDEHKKKIGQSGKGRLHSEETKFKLSKQKLGYKNPSFGKVGFNSRDGHPVQQFDKITSELVNTFGSIRYASMETKISDTSIGRVCKGLAKSAGGFIFKYLKK
jgi:group I intron endonuclease